MNGEVKFFRKRFFGGFNRDDVVKYVSKLAHERNEHLSAKEAAEAQVKEMTSEVEPLRLMSQTAQQSVDEANELREKAEKMLFETQQAKEIADRELDEMRFERSIAENDAHKLKMEIKFLKRELDDIRFEMSVAENDAHKQKMEVKFLKQELDKAQQDVQEGFSYKSEALESRLKLERLEQAKKQFDDLRPAIESLRSAFHD